MESTRIEITRHLPSLRRYARCLTGSQERGDNYVRACLEAILEDTSLISGNSDIRQGLFRAFHALWLRLQGHSDTDPLAGTTGAGEVARHIRALPVMEREALLLTTLSEFTADAAADILGVTRNDVLAYLERARADLNEQTATRVLIIEDEPIIAFDLAKTVTEMGHTVIGIADTCDRAVQLARAKRPGIVLADIQLRDGSSGIDAANEITDAMDVPVVFVTAFPERLLTGEQREPTYLITKPFDADVLRVTISQALLLTPAQEAVAAG